MLRANPTLDDSVQSIKPASVPIRPPSSIPVATRPTRFAAGYRHRSQGSKDGEMGDRGSTTSRDSVYRDSLSGSTLGSAGFQAQLEDSNKRDLAHAADLFLSSPTTLIKTNGSRILPPTVYEKRIRVGSETENTGEVNLSQDTDATPRPGDRTLKRSALSTLQPSIHTLRINPENDQARAKQYASLAAKGLGTKQTSTFVEDLANATDTALRSATDISFKNTPSPTSKKIERPAVDTHLEQDEAEELDHDEHLDRKKREVTFDAPKALDFQDDDVVEQQDQAYMEFDDLGSLAGSWGMENAFKSLENLNVSFDMGSKTRLDEDYTSFKGSEGKRRSQHTDDEGATSDYLASVSLPSKPSRRGEHSLKWENQTDTYSVADTSRIGGHTNLSRSSSIPTVHNASTGMLPEQSSFSHAEGHLLRFITALHPWDEWDQVKSLDLTKKEVESTIRLNHLVPNLDVLILNDNQVPYLTGVPKSVKTLQVRSNLLSNLTNFSHLVNLQYLDISHNNIEDLTGLSSLVHLRELIAEGNSITSVSSLQQMDGLIRLDVSRNCLTCLDFRYSRLQRLEFLNASHNKITQLDSLESLAGLIHANLAHNRIEDISLVQPLQRLRILRLSENKLLTFNANSFPGLRTLYLDDNRLQTLENCQMLTRLENFSARDQEGEGIAIDMTEFVNSRKLYLSGNPIHALDFEMGFFRLEYLEICAGCLSELPIGLDTLMPNLRGLNLSYNGLDSISALDGLHRLRRLIFVGNNLKSFSDVLSLVKRMRSLVTLDLRHNPLTSNMYPAMSIRQGSKYQDTYRTNQNSETEQDWRRRDVGFRRALPDAMYVKRSVYRSAILKSCKRLEWFDGGVILAKERERVPIVLGDLLDNYGRTYLTNNRREDEEEDFDYDTLHDNGYYYPEEYPDQMMMPQDDPDWLYSRRALGIPSAQADDEYEELEDNLEADDGRDPEDITDHSKRQSTVDSGSLNGQHDPRQRQQHHTSKSPIVRMASIGGAVQPTPRRLRTQSGHLMASPSPRAQTVLRSPTSTRQLKPSRMSSSSIFLSQQPIVQRPSEQRQQDDGEGLEDGDRRSAVRNWRDEVNEVSLRKQHQSPRLTSVQATDQPRAPRAHSSRSQQLRQQGQVAKETGHSGGSISGSHHSSQTSRSGSSNGRGRVGGEPATPGGVAGSVDHIHSSTLELTGLSSTAAVANNSNGRAPVPETPRRHITPRSKFSLPPLPPPTSILYQQPRPRPQHVRGRSDGAALMTNSQARLVRPRSQQHDLLDQETGDYAVLANTQSMVLPPQHHLSMSPMGGHPPLTASGTLLRAGHQRRRSFALYPQASAGARKRELLGLDLQQQQQQQQQYQSRNPTPPHGQSSPVVSPGYFGLNHYPSQTNQQQSMSPLGFGRGAALIFGTPGGAGNGGAPGRSSVPNTPSKSGRASRISLGQQQHYPQTLARDMERSETAE